MIEHGFSYKDIAEMEYKELLYWAEGLSEYYERLNKD